MNYIEKGVLTIWAFLCKEILHLKRWGYFMPVGGNGYWEASRNEETIELLGLLFPIENFNTINQGITFK